MPWFLELLEELGIEYRVGHPANIRAQETRKQKHDRRDTALLLTLLSEDRFAEIWMPSIEQRDLRTLLRDRDQWVRIRSRVPHSLQGIALNHALRQGRALGSRKEPERARYRERVPERAKIKSPSTLTFLYSRLAP